MTTVKRSRVLTLHKFGLKAYSVSFHDLKMFKLELQVKFFMILSHYKLFTAVKSNSLHNFKYL